MPAPTIDDLPTAPSRSDPPATFRSRADAFVAALGAFVTQVNALGAYMAAALITADATLAAQAALLATGGLSGTSTTSRSIGTGSKSFVTQTNRSFVPGSTVNVAVTASPSTNYMLGVVTAYNPTTGALDVDVQSAFGSGTHAAWTISFAGPRGATGPTASIGFTDSALTTLSPAAGTRYRLTARITSGTLPASPGAGGDPIELMTANDATTNYHTFTPNGAETVTVNGLAGSPLYFDGIAGEIIKLVPVAGGWEQGN